MSQVPTNTYRHCQSLVRGLEILSALNRVPSASASIMDLCRVTGLHRTTVKRLLETLREEGYVEWEPATNYYRLAFRVQQLSYGYRESVSITETAWPLMRSLSKTLVWPCSLVAPEGDEMVVRVSTRSFSPLSFHPGMPGRRMSMLTTAAGRAFLAFATDEVRENLLEILRSRTDEEGERSRNTRAVQEMIALTRKRGYGQNMGEWQEEPKFGAVAVPLCHQGRVLVCLNIVFLLRAGKDKQTEHRIVTELLRTRKLIEERFAMRS